VGIPQLRVVEDVATSAGAATAVCAINADPVGAAAGHFRLWHGECSGQFDGTPGGTFRGGPVRRRGAGAHAPRGEAVARHELILCGGLCPLAARHCRQPSPGGAAALCVPLASHDRPGRAEARRM